MRSGTRRTSGMALLATALLMGPTAMVAQSPAGDAPTAADSGVAAVMAWNEIAQNAAITTAKLPPPWSVVTLGVVQAAVYDAMVAIEGGYQPVGGVSLEPAPGASVEAAVATAAHAVLVHAFPDQQPDLDAAYATALAAIPEGDAKSAGVTVGTAAADGIIASREGDGTGADIGFQMPSAGPGVFQLPADQSPQTPWMARMRPLLMESADQFLPPPPPALDGELYARDLNEVQTVGGKDSTARTPEQTLIAQFWTSAAGAQHAVADRQLIADKGLSAMDAARLLAMTTMIPGDALIACMNAKYTYLFWRPVYAIAGADTDDNPATTADASWQPAIATPPHPEYPSNHGCFTAAQTEVLTAFLGTDQIDLTLPGIATADTMPSRHFATAADLLNEVENARVWGGIHFRNSTEVGAELGKSVADWALARDFLPAS
jgi:hypothetical protein